MIEWVLLLAFYGITNEMVVVDGFDDQVACISALEQAEKSGFKVDGFCIEKRSKLKPWKI